MTIQTFAQVSDLQAFTGQTLVTATATQALYVATTVIQSYCNQQIFPTANDVIVCDPLPSVSVRLPERPVTAVTQIRTFDDDTAAWHVEDITTWRWKRYGWLYATKRFDAKMWPYLNRDSVEVTYSHGYTTLPDSAINVCTTLAARLISNPMFLSSQASGMVNVAYQPVAELNVWEKALLADIVQAEMA